MEALRIILGHLVVFEVFGGICQKLVAFGYTWTQRPIRYHKGVVACGSICSHSVVFEGTLGAFGIIWEQKTHDAMHAWTLV